MRSLLLISHPTTGDLHGDVDVMALDVAVSSSDRYDRSREPSGDASGIGGGGTPSLYVRLPALDVADPDLDHVMLMRPDGLLLADTRGGADVARLGALLAVHEAELGLTDGATRIVAVVSSAAGVLGLGSMPGASPRLAGIGWDACALAADLRLPTAENGPWPAPLHQARSTVLIAAAAARVPAIDTPHATSGTAGLAEACGVAHRDGFRAKLALDPAQVPVINAIFGPPD